MYPTPRATLLMATGLPVTLLTAVLFPQLWVIGAAWIAAIAGLLFWDALMAPSARSVSIRPDLPVLMHVGTTEQAGFDVQQEKGRLLQRAEFRLTTGPRLTVLPERLAARTDSAALRADFDITAKRRGEGQIRTLWLRWQGPFGLMRRQKVQALDHAVPIVADTRPVKQAALEIFSRDAAFGQKIQQERGEGTEFDALTEFQTGMDKRAIDWKHSARHNTLLAKEFRTERNHNIVFAFDSGHLMCEPVGGMTKLDRALNASLVMAYVSLKIGDRVGYYGFDAKPYFYSQPIAGVNNFTRLQALSAEIDYSFSETNFTLGLSQLSQNLKRRSLIVVFTDFVDTTNAELMVENIARLTRRHLVLFVALRDAALEGLTQTYPETTADISRAVIAERLLKERDVVIARLQRLGVHILDTDAERLNGDLLNSFLDLKRRELL